MESFVASAVQFMAGTDQEANLRQAAALVRRAAEAGAALVALPELFCWRGDPREEPKSAQPIPGPLSDRLAEIAARCSVHLVAGSVLERAEDAARCYNTALLFGPDGTLLARYRKIHLFDVEVPGKVRARESATRKSGTEVVCAKTPLGRIGLAVCYDLRFPELFRRLADDGAEIVVVPSAFTAPTGRAHWHVLVRARAIENQCFLVAPNQVGPTVHGFDNYGHSLIVDPWGEILAEAGEEPGEVVAARLEAERLIETRRNLPSLEHRRLDR
ncbi:MAG: carbon-nitrogen hydrolase family protein [Deltaproteobacteria bacterium]|nr:MAG: carbon-nitrogen hydrolase family protein [Deltaproteobacteria bacterium]